MTAPRWPLNFSDTDHVPAKVQPVDEEKRFVFQEATLEEVSYILEKIVDQLNAVD